MFVLLIEGLGLSHPQAWPCFIGPRAILARAEWNIA
jgi:hypothetical protein